MSNRTLMLSLIMTLNSKLNAIELNLILSIVALLSSIVFRCIELDCIHCGALRKTSSDSCEFEDPASQKR